MKDIGAQIADARRAAGLSQKQLADMVGMSQQGVDSIEKGAVSRPRKLPELAAALGLDLPALIGDVPGGMPADARPMPGPDLTGARDLPVYPVAIGPDGREFVTFDAIDRIRRPAPLEHVRGGYGLLIVGISMSPRFEPGDVALVNPHLPPVPGADVVLYAGDEAAGSRPAITARLAGATGEEWLLRQFGANLKLAEPRAEWPTCHRIVGIYARR